MLERIAKQIKLLLPSLSTVITVSSIYPPPPPPITTNNNNENNNKNKNDNLNEDVMYFELN